MIKSELIQRIASANPHLYHRDVENIVSVIFDEIISALARGERVELRGFGAFTVKHRMPRVGRNPRTGATVHVEEKFVPFFKTGKELRERLNKPEAEAATQEPGSPSPAGPPGTQGGQGGPGGQGGQGGGMPHAGSGGSTPGVGNS